MQIKVYNLLDPNSNIFLAHFRNPQARNKS